MSRTTQFEVSVVGSDLKLKIGKPLNITTIKNFVFIVGAQRSGTTYLYNILDEHPQIAMAKPVKPEPKFFLNDIEFKAGKQYYLQKYFNDVDDNVKVFGEKGTSYIEFSYVADRIYSFFANAKILIILRNPVDRALSNYFFSVDNGLESRSLQEVFVENLAIPELKVQTSVSPFSYLERGHYSDMIKPYINIFKNNLKVVIFEELTGSIDSVQSIYRFLEVDPLFRPPSLNNKINQSKSKVEGQVIEVRNVLHSYFLPHIKSLENLLERKIELWHD